MTVLHAYYFWQANLLAHGNAKQKIPKPSHIGTWQILISRTETLASLTKQSSIGLQVSLLHLKTRTQTIMITN